MPVVITLGALILVIIIIVAIYILIKAIKWLAVNTIVGLILLGALIKLEVLEGLEIGPLELILVAVGGLIGVFIIVLLYFLGPYR